MNNKTLAIGALCSGRGSNLLAILSQIKAGGLKAEIKLVITDRPQAGVLAKAREEGLKAVCLPRKNFARQAEFEQAIVTQFEEAGVGLVILAGFERLIGPTLLAAFPDRIMNIHPALLPAFPGLGVWADQIDYGVKIAGCTVHFVDGGLDSGPIIMQAAVPVLDDDTPESLAGRILKQEHIIYAQALKLYAEDRLVILGRKVIVKDSAGNETPDSSSALIWPGK